jgi:hypothetical protein
MFALLAAQSLPPTADKPKWWMNGALADAKTEYIKTAD